MSTAKEAILNGLEGISDDVQDEFESLDINWNRGTYAKWTANPNIRELYYKNYTLIYEVLKDEIQIHEVHNCAKMIRQFNK